LESGQVPAGGEAAGERRPAPSLDEVTSVSGVPLFYDRAGQPMTLREYAEKFSDLGYRILAQDTAGGVEVITAWLGIDQGSGLGEEPLLMFGTLVKDPGDPDGRSEYFSASESEARATHARVRAGLADT
jgi:hypothetical protein